MTSPALVVEYYGAAGRVPVADTAFPHSQAPWDVMMLAQVDGPR